MRGLRRLILAGVAIAAACGLWVRAAKSPKAAARPVVVEISLTGEVQPISARYVVSGIAHANQIGAAAVLLELSTPGGFYESMKEIKEAIENSRVPVITYVTPSGARSASAGFFILLTGDIAVMAPGTNTGAAHPVVLGDVNIGATEKTKLLNDALAQIRAIAQRRGRNVKLAEAAVQESKSFTDEEALKGNLINAIASTPQQIFNEFDGKTVTRINGSTTTLHLKDAIIVPYTMSGYDHFLAWITDPNIAFLFGAIGLALLYLEFTHPGMVAPGVFGAIALVLALFAFHLMPINYLGVVLILVAIGMFALEAKFTSHGVLALGGIIAMTLGAMILIKSPWPGTHIHFVTSLAVTVPLAVISIILTRVALEAASRKSVSGVAGMIGLVVIARTDLGPEGEVLVHGEIWKARTAGKITKGSRVRVRGVDGLTLLVEPEQETH